MDLTNELTRISDVYLKSSFHLSSFVSDVQHGLKDTLSRNAHLHGRVKAFVDGTPPAPPQDPHADLIEIRMTDDELAALFGIVDDHMEGVRRYPTMLLNASFIYLVALFDAFVSDSLTAVLRARPEMLRSNRKLSYETILAATDRDDLIAHMAEREVGEFAYQSFRAKSSYLRDRFGIEMPSPEEADLDTVVERLARRNLLVHNNGFVNSAYLDSVRQDPPVVGKQLEVTEPYFNVAAQEFIAMARHLTRTLTEKFAGNSSNRANRLDLPSR